MTHRDGAFASSTDWYTTHSGLNYSESPSEKGKPRMKKDIYEILYYTLYQRVGNYMYFCTKSMNQICNFL